ncbi:MAG: hypothetical protein ABIR37_01120 [Candidatus Saccharimonadales bacterium]
MTLASPRRKIAKKTLLVLLAALFLATTLLPARPALAADDFSLQVSPSPLFETLKPGIPTQLELKIRNGGTKAETLKIEPRSFSVEDTSEKVKLGDSIPPDIAQWVSFSNPTFTIRPGEWFTQNVRVALPKDAGFSYSFALLISRKDEPKAVAGSRLLKGSVAVFTLLNVDRPGATRKLDTASLTTSRGFYEYVPATLHVKIKNTGNSIVQPYGDIYIQRGAKDLEPLDTLRVNENRGYILPGTTRTLTTEWNKGFPRYETTVDSNGKTSRKTIWEWSKIPDFRLGRYTAKLVAVYNDGHRDVPIMSEVSFWVIPWKILLGMLAVALLLFFGVGASIRKIFSIVRSKIPRKPEA